MQRRKPKFSNSQILDIYILSAMRLIIQYSLFTTVRDRLFAFLKKCSKLLKLSPLIFNFSRYKILMFLPYEG